MLRVLPVAVVVRLVVIESFVASFSVPSESALAQPPSSFSYRLYVVSLSLLNSVLQDNGGAHPLVMDALAEMSEAQMQMRLTHPPVRTQYPRRGEKRRRRGYSLYHIFLES